MPAFFETKRMLFRGFVPEDLDALARICSEVEGSRYVGDGKPLTRKLTQLWIENSINNVDRFGYGTGALIDLATTELIGWAGFARPDDLDEELIYGFTQSHWGRGLGSEVLVGLIQYATNELGHSTLRATVHPDNKASIAMLQRQQFELIDRCYDGDPQCYLFVREV